LFVSVAVNDSLVSSLYDYIDLPVVVLAVFAVDVVVLPAVELTVVVGTGVVVETVVPCVRTQQTHVWSNNHLKPLSIAPQSRVQSLTTKKNQRRNSTWLNLSSLFDFRCQRTVVRTFCETVST